MIRAETQTDLIRVNDGTSGTSPTASITQTSGGATITITDSTGTTTANISNGQNGQNGQDGVSPTATVTQTSTGATITITDSQGTTTADISDGAAADFEIGGKNLIRYSELVPLKDYPFMDTEKWNTYTDDSFVPSVGQWCRYGGDIGGSVVKEGDWTTVKIGFIAYVPPIEGLEDEPLL